MKNKNVLMLEVSAADGITSEFYELDDNWDAMTSQQREEVVDDYLHSATVHCIHAIAAFGPSEGIWERKTYRWSDYSAAELEQMGCLTTAEEAFGEFEDDEDEDYWDEDWDRQVLRVCFRHPTHKAHEMREWVFAELPDDWDLWSKQQQADYLWFDWIPKHLNLELWLDGENGYARFIDIAAITASDLKAGRYLFTKNEWFNLVEGRSCAKA